MIGKNKNRLTGDFLFSLNFFGDFGNIFISFFTLPRLRVKINFLNLKSKRAPTSL